MSDETVVSRLNLDERLSENSDESHPCASTACKNTVPFDDEPFCFVHSPDEGSHVRDYSYKAIEAKRCATLTVTVRLDPVYGTFHTPESCQEQVQAILSSSIPHYNPVVTLVEEES